MPEESNRPDGVTNRGTVHQVNQAWNRSLTSQCILTIEDDPAIRRGIVDALRYAGYRVLEEGRGDSGAEAAVRND